MRQETCSGDHRSKCPSCKERSDRSPTVVTAAFTLHFKAVNTHAYGDFSCEKPLSVALMCTGNMLYRLFVVTHYLDIRILTEAHKLQASRISNSQTTCSFVLIVIVTGQSTKSGDCVDIHGRWYFECVHYSWLTFPLLTVCHKATTVAHPAAPPQQARPWTTTHTPSTFTVKL